VKVIVYATLSGGKWDKTHEQNRRIYDTSGISPTIHTSKGGNQKVKIAAIRKREGQTLEVKESDISNAITTVQKDNLIVYGSLYTSATPDFMRISGGGLL